MVTNINIRIFFVILFDLCRWSRADFFSSISDMEFLLDTQEETINSLDDYFARESKRLLDLEKQMHRYQMEYQKAIKDVTNYLKNPLHSYILIKSLTTDLDLIENIVYKSSEYKKSKEVEYPAQEDLDGAVHAIARLRVTYQLNVSDMANGILDKTLSSPMSSYDCFLIGKALYISKDFSNGLVWMMEALDKYKPLELDVSPVSEFQIMENICYGFYSMNDTRSAMVWDNWLVALRMNDCEQKDLAPIIQRYQKRLAKDELLRSTKKRLILNEAQKNEATMYNYETLCRNEVELPDEVVKRLKCSYLTGPHPYLRLAPIKMEQLYIDPDVTMFHEVMSDDEIEHIIKMGEPKLERARVYNPKKVDGDFTQYRICKETAFEDRDSEVIARISQRISDLSGLNMETAERLQLINYGIGGQYEPHRDYFPNNTLSNRQATVIFYMTDVVQGGATVFTELGLTVFPVKGAAMYWQNLHPSGEGDLATLHASCPVLRGSKWISVKWILQEGQEFIKPCNLEYQAANYRHNIISPKPKSPHVRYHNAYTVL